MKIGRNTQERIDTIKDEALEVKRQLETLHARLAEHPGSIRKPTTVKRLIYYV